MDEYTCGFLTWTNKKYLDRYTQVEAMAVHYSHPVLLIEFDQDKSFSLQDKSEIRADISVTEISSKLVLLTLAFPTLRLIWSSSVHATVEIFEDLKVN